ncbi:MAG: hypothetical protein IPL61_14905 [Myxococcales bacterium]|nr:hypothetical protein [Myxococcales bacterium]
MRAGLVALVVSIAGAAHGQPRVDHEALGYQLAADGELERALVEFDLAYKATKAPQLLFAMGRIHTLRGDCVRANDLFERFLATQPGPKAIEAATAEIGRCEPAPIQIAPEPPPTPAPPRPVAPPVAPHAPRSSFASAMVHDRVVQVGVVSGVVAGGLLIYGLHLSCWDGVCEGSYADFDDKRALAPKVGVASAAFGIAAGALVTTGVVRYLLRSDDETALDVALVPRVDGGALAVGGSF